MKCNERLKYTHAWFKHGLANLVIGKYGANLLAHHPLRLAQRAAVFSIGCVTCLAFTPNLSFGGASAVDGSAHHACLDASGFINFDETKNQDATPACYENYSYGYASPTQRIGKANAVVCTDWGNCYNEVHSNIDGVVYYKDSAGYFWCGVFDSVAKKYLGVVARTREADGGSCPISITTTVVPAAGGVFECSPNPVEAGDSATCIAQPNAGYSFGSFTGNACSKTNGNECTFSNIATAKTVTANFVAAKHPITTIVVPDSSGTVTCNPASVTHGTGTTCTATPNVGYLFDNFSGACTGTACTLSAVTAPTTVTGNFHLASDPFLGKTVVLQTQAGGLVTIPGVGPGGSTLYADRFIINNFRLAGVGFEKQGENLLGHYSADFHVQFLDNYGNIATYNGMTGRADLEGGIDNFQALYTARTSKTQLGQFKVTLNKATFSGQTSLDTAMVVSLADIPSATLTIGGAPSYNITYQVPFSINGQYALDGGGEIDVPDLDAGYMVTTTAIPEAGGSITCAPNPVRQGGTSVCTATANANYRLGDFNGDCTGTTCVLSNVTGPKTVNARFWVGPDPFLGRHVVLKTQDGGSVTLPGVGPGGATLYAKEFRIDNFTLAPAGFVDSGANLIGHYSGDFHVAFLNADGTPAVHNGITGRADLIGGVDNFQVLYTNRVDQFAAGRFVMTLQVAEFEGLSNLGTPLEVELANVPDADVTLGGSPNYSVNYTKPFTINSKYDPGTGTETVPPLLATHPITAIALPAAGGTVTCNPNAVIQGSGSTCTPTPKAGYKFKNFSGDCTGATCVFTNVTGPKTVTANFAFASDPFIGQTVILQATPPGKLVTLPGVGPEGATLYAKEFKIDNFAIDPDVEFTKSGANLIGVYDADFHAVFLNANGTPATHNGIAGRADLLGRVNNFKVRFVNRTSPFTTGTFDMGLEMATFGGVTSIGSNMVVSLGTPEPKAKVTIGPAPNYVITYITPFSINGKYAINGGTEVQVPGLTADKFDIVPIIDPAGRGTVTCNPDPVPKGQVSNCTVTANAGFRIGSVTGCGITATSNPYRTTAITANCALTAKFVALPSGITVTPTTGLITTEAAGTATFTVKLNSLPSANVTFTLSSSNPAEGTVAPTSLIFTPANWNTAQTVTVTGKDDDQVDGNKAYTISSTAVVTTDTNYSASKITVNVTNNDNDVASSGHGSKVNVTHAWSSIALTPATLINSTIVGGVNTLTGAPVVIAGVPSYNGADPGIAQIKNVTATGFDLHFREWEYQDNLHGLEVIDYLMLKSGRVTFTDGTILEVGQFGLSGTNAWRTVGFKAAFPAQPHLFLTVQTLNDPATVIARARTVTTSTFQAALFEQEKDMSTGHPLETVGYLAMYNPNNSGKLNLGGTIATPAVIPYVLQKTTVDHRFTPILSQRIFIEEENSMDDKIAHADESVHFLALGNRTFAQQTSNNDADTASLRRIPAGLPSAYKAEWGIWHNGIVGKTGTPLAPNWRVLPFANTYVNPVVVIKPVSNLDAEPGVVRMRNVTPTSLEAFYQEWQPLDGVHNTAESVFYMVIESGTRVFPANGLRFKVGLISTNKLAAANQWSRVTITNPTDTIAPAVFTSVMTYNNAEAVTTRVKNVTTTGFDIAMDERELDNNGHPNEKLGWIAIDDGETTFSNGRIFQAFLTQVSSTLEPVSLIPDNTSWVRTTRFPIILSDVNSYKEPDPITLRFNSNTLTNKQIQLQLSEETSKDAEIVHVLEDVAVFVGD